jgi:formate hydrogenlyase transcriptional activator
MRKSTKGSVKGARLEEAREFKELLLELAGNLIAVPPPDISGAIQGILRFVGDFWGFDRILLAEAMDDGKPKVALSFEGQGTQPLPGGSLEMPWLMGRIRSRDTVVLERVPGDLPDHATADRRTCTKASLKSMLAVPIEVNGYIWGALVFCSPGMERPWPQSVVKEFRYLAKVLANGLERRNAAEQINEFGEFERLLSEVSAKYISLPFDEIEMSAQNDFRRLARLIGAERCILHLYDQESQDWRKGGVWYMWEKGGWSDTEDGVARTTEELLQEDPELLETWQYVFDMWSQGEVVQFSDPKELTGEAVKTKKLWSALGIKSYMSVPIMVAGKPAGALIVGATRVHRIWPDDMVPRLRLFGEVFINALKRQQSEESLRSALTEVKRLKEQVQADYTYLREEINLEHDFGGIVGKSRSLTQILVKARQVARTDVTVLILGETGTGKGLIARAIHNLSKRKERPLVQVNCAALTPTLIESELFGHERGAFTGAQARKAGRFELADGTTLFLDEIGDLPLDLQSKLLRVLQDGEFERVGGTTTIKTDARVIAATNKDLQKEVEAGRFRLDLWYRLNVFPVYVPPLRERTEDIPLFVNFFVNKYAKWIGKRFDTVSQKAIRELQNYPWIGNIRELENLIERAVITSPEGHLQVEIPSQPSPVKVNRIRKLEDLEREYILEVLERTYWKIQGPQGAAQLLGFKPSTLRTRMKKLAIGRPSFRG